jgi:hypothetical protein
MPLISKSNNRILANNARAADVAEKAVQEILPVQQQRYYDAFRVQGIESVLYARLLQGKPCSCQSANKALNTRLNKEGKADFGTINEMLSGSMEFSITNYGQSDNRRFGYGNETSPEAPELKQQGVFDVISRGEDFPQARHTNEKDFGDNGPFDPETLDDMVSAFDGSYAGFLDARCPVCFGTGFVGGYSPYQAIRYVIPCNEAELDAASEISYVDRPFVATSSWFEFKTVLPKGAYDIDAFRTMNMERAVPMTLKIDGRIILAPREVLPLCDGRPHIIRVEFKEPTKWTHFEIQISVSNMKTYFEFPRLTSSSDTSVMDPTNPFQIVLSPNIPTLKEMDVIAESMFGKTLIVTNVNDWNTRQRNVLGWECEVRVAQPQEIYNILPHRRPTTTKNQTTLMARDNARGPYRT